MRWRNRKEKSFAGAEAAKMVNQSGITLVLQLEVLSEGGALNVNGWAPSSATVPPKDSLEPPSIAL